MKSVRLFTKWYAGTAANWVKLCAKYYAVVSVSMFVIGFIGGIAMSI